MSRLTHGSELTEAVIQICRPRGVRVSVSDRVDVALAAKADGVQLGARSLLICRPNQSPNRKTARNVSAPS